MTDGSPTQADDSPIELAREAPFTLGVLRVTPATREAAAGNTRETLEPRVMQALIALARRRGEVVSRDELIDTCWDGRIVGDDAINGCVAKVRRLGEAHQAFVIETIARVGYRLTESRPAPTPTPTKVRRGPWVRLAASATLALVVLAGVGVWTLRERPVMRVAVLPFEALPTDGANQALAFRVRDQISGVLTARELVVASSGPARGARLVVGGTVEQSGGKALVRVHLDDPRSRTVLWQGVFEGPAGLDSPTPERAAAKVTELVFAASEVIKSSNDRVRPDALKAFLLGAEGAIEGRELEPLEFYRSFREKEPNLSIAQSAYAQQLLQASRLQSPDVARTWKLEAIAASKRAMTLDPKNGSAYIILSQSADPFDLQTRQMWLLRGLENVPNGSSLMTNEGLLLASAGRPKEGLPLIRRGLALDPLSQQKTFGDATYLGTIGLVEEGRAMLERARRIWPNNPNESLQTLTFAVHFMSPEDGLETLDELQSRHPELAATAPLWRQYFEALKCRCGQAVAAQRIDAAGAEGDVSPRFSIAAISRLGEVDRAIDVAGRDFGTANYADVRFLFAENTGPMRRQPRFMALTAKLGLAAYWKATDRWPEFCAEPGLPYDCKVEAAKYK
jgi:DNA-binding winged helix-turn-helix (wHTH) protein